MQSNISDLYMLGNLITKLFFHIQSEWDKYATEAGLNPLEVTLLWTIWTSEGKATVTSLADKIDRGKSTISKVVFELETSGLVSRKKLSDRRSYSFQLTDRGAGILRSLIDRNLESTFYETLKTLDPTAFNVTVETLKALLESFAGREMRQKMERTAQRLEQD